MTTCPPASRRSLAWTPPSACLLALLALALGGAAAGCSSGGTASASTSSEAQGANGLVSDLDVIAADEDVGVEFEFTLRADVARELSVTFEFSEDRGRTFTAATVSSAVSSSHAAPGAGATEGASGDTLLADPEGQVYRRMWLAADDLGPAVAQGDLVLRVTPGNPTTDTPGTAAVSAAFSLGAQSAPTVSAISTPSSTAGGRIEFRYTVEDAQGDYVDIDVEYSTDGGSSYVAATAEGGDGTTALATSDTGVEHTVLWNAQVDVPGTFAAATRLRIRARDTAPGGFAESGLFSMRTYAPSIRLVTVNEIAASMNGSVPFTDTAGQSRDFRLLLPPTGFVLSVEAITHAFGAPLDEASLEVTCSRALGGGSYAAGTDLGARFTVAPGGWQGSLLVPADLAFPDGENTVTARVSDTLGNVSDAQALTFTVRVPTNAMLPFEATDRWELDFERDNYSISYSVDSGGEVTITSKSASNGVADFVEDLRTIGLNSASPPQGAQDAGLNELVLGLVREAVRGGLNELFGHDYDGTLSAGSANVSFHLESAGSGRSVIGIGGDDPIIGFTIGRAEFDYRNAHANDNTAVDLGVFTTNVIDFFINDSFSFKQRFDPLIEGRGTPLGFHADDVTVLASDFDRLDPANSASENQRYDDIADAIDAIARMVAVIVAHEIGHSVGLVANSAPSRGLFGGEFNASFAGPSTSSYHLDTPGNNVMSASLSFSSSIATGSGAPSFGSLNTAYLLQRILLR